jgi:hypothetical protein
MAYPSDEHPGKTLASSITLLRNLSEQEQESISGGFFMYYNQTQINSVADHNTNFSGVIGAGNGDSGDGASLTGTLHNSGSASYQFTQTTLILGCSDQMIFYMLPSLLRFMSIIGI